MIVDSLGDNLPCFVIGPCPSWRYLHQDRLAISNTQKEEQDGDGLVGDRVIVGDMFSW